jgi:hypothetical protein
MAFFTRALLACLLALPAAGRALASPPADDIVVESLKGDVRVVSRGAPLAARPGSVLALAAAVRTGRDGAIDLRQGDTSISVSPDTQLDFPAQAAAGPIERVVQPAGNAYYDVGPRGNRRMRVETPYLVAVIKGTQFNVAVSADTSTISLHEGRLEILATDAGVAAVELHAGEIAVRSSGEKSIRVLRPQRGGAGTTSTAPGAAGDESSAALSPPGKGGNGPDLPGDGPPFGDEPGDLLGPDDSAAPTDPSQDGLTEGIDIGVDELGSGSVGADAGVDVGGEIGAASLNAGIDLGAGSADVGIAAGADLGAASADIGADAGVDLAAGTVDAGMDAGIDAGPVSADAGVDVGADLGSGTVDAGVDAGLDVGGVAIDAGADVGVDAGAGTVDAGVDTGVAGVDAGVETGVDLTGSDAGVDLGVDVLGTEIDIGLGGSDSTGGNDSAESGDSGGLPGLGGILSRPRN